MEGLTRKPSTVAFPSGDSEKPGDPTRPASNWWMFNRDLEHTSRVPLNGVMRLTKLWQKTFPGAYFIKQPILGDNTLLVGMSCVGLYHLIATFQALDPHTGNVLWSHRPPYDNNVYTTPVAVNGRVYLVDRGGALTCLKIADGSVVWSNPFTPYDITFSGLAAAFGNIYFLTSKGVLRAHNAKTGAEVWQFDLGDYPPYNGSSPAIGFGNVYIGSSHGLRVFDAITGAPKWSAIDSPGNGNASPLLVYDVGVGNPPVVIIGAVDNSLRAYHAQGGTLLWKYDGNTPLEFTTPATNDRKVYLLQERTIVELNAVTGQLINTSPDLGHIHGRGPTIAGNHLFVINTYEDNRLIALNLSNLEIAQQVHIPPVRNYATASTIATPSVEDGRLFVSVGDTVFAYHKLIFRRKALKTTRFPTKISRRVTRADRLSSKKARNR